MPIDRAQSHLSFTRRTALGLLGAAAALPLASRGGTAMADASTGSPPIYRGEHAVKPLPFDPKKLTGLSEKLVVSHHQKKFGGGGWRLSARETPIGALPREGAP